MKTILPRQEAIQVEVDGDRIKLLQTDYISDEDSQIFVALANLQGFINSLQALLDEENKIRSMCDEDEG